MIGLDTNVLVRYIMQDDANQSKKATNLIEKELTQKNSGYISIVTLIEVIWVLKSGYKQNKTILIEVIEALIKTKELLVDRLDIVHLALKTYKKGNGDFSDSVIAMICNDVGCSKILTFDKKALSVGMEKLE